MIKYHRGDVIWVFAPDGKGGLKPRPVVVFQTVTKGSDAISVYCTTQNNGDDLNTIFVKCDSEVGELMGIEQDTYIRPHNIITIPAKSIIRKIGKCPLMQQIQLIVDRRMCG